MLKEPQGEDEVEAFCRSFATQTRKLPGEDAIGLKAEMRDLIANKQWRFVFALENRRHHPTVLHVPAVFSLPTMNSIAVY